VKGTDDSSNCTLSISSMESASLSISSNKKQGKAIPELVRNYQKSNDLVLF
jgi:hypothetical protein